MFRQPTKIRKQRIVSARAYPCRTDQASAPDWQLRKNTREYLYGASWGAMPPSPCRKQSPAGHPGSATAPGLPSLPETVGSKQRIPHRSSACTGESLRRPFRRQDRARLRARAAREGLYPASLSASVPSKSNTTSRYFTLQSLCPNRIDGKKKICRNILFCLKERSGKTRGAAKASPSGNNQTSTP